VDLNAVTYEELRALDLSTTQAKRLLTYRERAGGFSSIDDIDEVPGFPEAVREGLKQRLTV
jgi:competence protein ComEA